MKFSKKEVKDLFVAWLMISIAFAVLLSGGIKSILSMNVFIVSFLISAFTVGISFLFHELMHKFMAQKYHLWAEFRAFYGMLWLAIAFSLFGFIIAAPGAVMIRGFLTKEKNGKISLAGPFTNIILAFLFLVLLLFVSSEGILNLFFYYGVSINSLLALFNLIPAKPFDGYGVYAWNKIIYIIVVMLTLGLFLARFIM